MHARLRTHLSLNFLLILFLGMGLAAALAWFTVEKLYLDTQRENLLAQARLAAAALQGQDLAQLSVEPYSQTTNLSPGIHTHLFDNLDASVTVLQIQPGSLYGRTPPESTAADPSAQELLSRAEIASAARGTPATSIRRVASAGNGRVLYAAAPVYDAQGRLVGVLYLATPLPAGGLPASAVFTFAGAFLLAALAALGLGLFLSRRIARPLEAISAAAGNVAAGDLQQKVQASAPIRELESLGSSFNSMTASLRQSERARNAFLADVTHELRTPLTVINGTIETLEDGAMDDLENRASLLASMQRETQRLIRLVNDLLVLTRADAGALKLGLRPLDLTALARERCETLQALAASQDVSLQVDSAHPVLVRGDPDRLAQVLDNLLDNAIRHSPPGSVVRVSLQKVGQDWRCCVEDTGSGILPEHLPFIFERFYRADNARDRAAGGSGLGLAIMRALVQAHGGTVAAESQPGQVTRVSFSLPAASALPQS